MRRRAAGHRRINDVVYHVEDLAEKVAKALWKEDIGEMRVYLLAAERRNREWCRVWSEERGFLRAVGRLYPNGRFERLKSKVADDTTRKRGWKAALKAMAGAMTVQRVMTS